MVKLLIIDDDAEFRKNVGDCLAREGYEIIAASSGEEALEEIRSKRPQLILLDVSMPGMDGIETLKEIKQIDQGAFVTIITGLRDEDVTRKALKLGAANVLHKPFNMDFLKRSLKGWSAHIEAKELSKNDILVLDYDEKKYKTILEVFIKKGYVVKTIEAVARDCPKVEADMLLFRADILKEQVFDLLSQYKKGNPSLPILVTIDPAASKETIEKFKEYGSTGYLSDSMPLYQLIFAIYEMLSCIKPKKPETSEYNLGDSILIIDDEPDICEYTQKFLTQQGYRVYTLTDPRQAEKEIESINPAIVLLDIVMPQMDGLQVLERIKKINPNIRVVMMSGVKDDFICKQAIKDGASDYLVKPFSLDQLKFTVLANSIKSRNNP
jgi:DNA-binding response OmpR family regulator